ncbi:MAG TPA: toll/interleukin-1 receptor domain-containing protein [Candidatus Micrarchaeaceae archaeon]|nr:toll/interleukin-1 receptor domain-containing protein [Candidatus Micrarchaeaceae archaeon]
MNIPPRGLSRKSLALFANVLAAYTHSQLNNLFMLFGIEERAGSGSNKLARAMAVVTDADKDPTAQTQVLDLLWHVLDERGMLPRTRIDLDHDESALLGSLQKDALIPTTSHDAAATDGGTKTESDPRAGVAHEPRHQSDSDHSDAGTKTTYDYDFFISHATEDKSAFVRPLAEELVQRGLRVWYDEFSLDIGDSLRESIDFGLRASEYGVVILSKAFFDKEWPNKELNGLNALERDGRKVILPVWHGVNESDVRAFSPLLADRVAAKSARGVKSVANDLQRILGRPTPSGPATMRVAPSEPGKHFHAHLRAPNSQAWAVVVVGAVPERQAPLDDEAHDVIQASFLSLAPDAHCERQTDDYASWVRRGSDSAQALWIGEAFPGPVVVMMRAMEVTITPEGGQIVMSDLVEWWIDALSATRPIFAASGLSDVAVGLAFNPYPVDGPSINGVAFGNLPPAQRIAEAHMIPPWQFQSPVTTTDRITEDLTAAAASLLKVYSYRRLDATLASVRARVAGEPRTEGAAVAPRPEGPLDPTASQTNQEPRSQQVAEAISLIRVVTEEVTAPRLDGTRGSGLYRVPIQLSRQPGARWTQLFVEAWNHPSSFTTMHRPGIASVVADRIVLDGTTLEEVKIYHRDTLRLAVEVANRQSAADEEAERLAADRRAERQRQHAEEVRRAADDIKFD